MSDYNSENDYNSLQNRYGSYEGNSYSTAQSNYGTTANPYSDSSYQNSYDYQGSQNALSANMSQVLTRAFAFMLVALLVTAVTSYGVARSESAMKAIYGGNTYMFLLLFEVVIAMVAQSFMRKDNLIGSAIGFLAYSIMNGVTLSFIFYAYSPKIILEAFVISATVFGLMAVYGMITNKNLASWGSIGIMVLMGSLVLSFFNLVIFRSSSTDWLITAVVLVVFVGLTAWDVQKLKNADMIANSCGERTLTVLGLYGALELYLDFINIFLRVLSILGRSRD